jgi:16S rRNA (uracil1498-N3)-methyltransferase
VRLTRVHVPGPLAAAGEVSLPEAAAAHVARVLRLRPGARLVLFDGSGADFLAEISDIAGSRVRARIDGRAEGLPESPLAVTLVQAVSRGERMDWTLQKATELGVQRIQPVLAARSVVRLDERQGERRLRHWQAVVASACEQCGRSVLPAMEPPLELPRYLAGPRGAALRLVLSPDAATSLATSAGRLDGDGGGIELLIGPEGGLEAAEVAEATRAGFEPVSLGPRVLRTETAGIAALAVLQALAGDLR